MTDKSKYTYSPHTTDWLNSTNVAARKKYGQYMTPREVSLNLVESIKDFPENAHVLDPSSGTGEIIRAVNHLHPDAETFGWEIDPAIMGYAETNFPGTVFTNCDALTAHVPPHERYDVVAGNPPFFEFSPNPAIKKRFADIIGGRTNIYGLFFRVGLDALKPGGTLAYIVPPSMNTGAYFEKLRQYILQHATIESLHIITEHDMFDQAQVVIQIIVLKKRLTPIRAEDIPQQSPHHYVYDNGQTNHNRYRKIIFCENSTPLHTYLTNPATCNLSDAGYRVKTGTVIWNQRTESLTNTPGPDTVPLIWSKDITTHHTFQLSDSIRYRYVTTASSDMGPAIVSNRIVGSVGNPNLKFAIVDPGQRFVAENHVNVIYPDPDGSQTFTVAELYTKLCAADYTSVLKHMTGNTQLSSKELNYLIRVPLAGGQT